jgi:transcription elongation GreA/GreB family factor
MSRAFVKESDDEGVELPDRPVSPHPNLVTAAGLAVIESTLNRFEATHDESVRNGDRAAAASASRELRYWRARRASARVVGPTSDKSRVHFGAVVAVRRDDGRTQTFQIVGEDEADPSSGTLSHASPLARAVLGGVAGEIIDSAVGEVEILEIK